MKCEDIQELFGTYFDLPEDDLRRKCVDEHIQRCRACAEEFDVWLESTSLIRSVQEIPEIPMKTPRISNRVMDQIYQNESWRIPVSNRIYAIPYRMRRNLTAVIALCLAIFMFSFLVHLVNGGTVYNTGEISPYGINQVANASGKPSTEEPPLSVHSISKTAVASASDLIIEPAKLSALHTPDYWLALSLLGLISTLLIMNWLSRTRS